MMAVPNQEVGFTILGTGVVADYHRQAITANAELAVRLEDEIYQRKNHP